MPPVLDRKMILAELELIAEFLCQKSARWTETIEEGPRGYTHSLYPEALGILLHKPNRNRIEQLLQNAWRWVLYPRYSPMIEVVEGLTYRSVLVGHDVPIDIPHYAVTRRGIGLDQLMMDEHFRLLPHISAEAFKQEHVNIGDLPVGTVIEQGVGRQSTATIGTGVLQADTEADPI